MRKVKITKEFEQRICIEKIVDTPTYRYRHRRDYDTNKEWIERIERKKLLTTRALTGWQFIKWVGEDNA